MSLSTKESPPAQARSNQERRQKNDGPPNGIERRQRFADRRSENNEEYVSFYIDQKLLGISVLNVREVLPMQPITPIPQANRALAGLLNLRGQIVTVIDLRIRLGLTPRSPDAEAMSVIVENGGELYSLLVDAIGDVIPVAKINFSSPPATLAPHWQQCCEGVYPLPQGLLVIVDVKALLALNTNEFKIPTKGN